MPSYRKMHRMFAVALFCLAHDGIDAANDKSLGSLRGQEWVQECRQRGFDPSQLACQTCQILAASSALEATRTTVIEDCQQCCQSYKDTQSLRQPYSSAVLGIPTTKQQLDSEMETFLREDWDDLVKNIPGGSTRLQKINMKDDRTVMSNSFWFVRTPAEVHFLNEPLPEEASSKTTTSTKSLSEEEVAKMAKETITLYGWKREDIRDMIQTLLA